MHTKSTEWEWLTSSRINKQYFRIEDLSPPFGNACGITSDKCDTLKNNLLRIDLNLVYTKVKMIKQIKVGSTMQTTSRHSTNMQQYVLQKTTISTLSIAGH